MRSRVLVTLLLCSGYSLASDTTHDSTSELLANFDSLNNDGEKVEIHGQNDQARVDSDIKGFVEAYAGEFPNEDGKLDLGVNINDKDPFLLESVSKDPSVIAEGAAANSPPHGPDFFESINRRRKGGSSTSNDPTVATPDSDIITSTEIRSVKPGNIIKISHGGNLRHTSLQETSVEKITSLIPPPTTTIEPEVPSPTSVENIPAPPVDSSLAVPKENIPAPTPELPPPSHPSHPSHTPSDIESVKSSTKDHATTTTTKEIIPEPVSPIPPVEQVDEKTKLSSDPPVNKSDQKPESVLLEPPTSSAEPIKTTELEKVSTTSTLKLAPTLELPKTEAPLNPIPTPEPNHVLKAPPNPHVLEPKNDNNGVSLEETIKNVLDMHFKDLLPKVSSSSNLEEKKDPQVDEIKPQEINSPKVEEIQPQEKRNPSIEETKLQENGPIVEMLSNSESGINGLGIEEKVKNVLDNYFKARELLSAKPHEVSSPEPVSIVTEIQPQLSDPAPAPQQSSSSTKAIPEPKVITITKTSGPKTTLLPTVTQTFSQPSNPESNAEVDPTPEKDSNEFSLEKILKENFKSDNLDIEKLKLLLGNVLNLDDNTGQEDSPESLGLSEPLKPSSSASLPVSNNLRVNEDSLTDSIVDFAQLEKENQDSDDEVDENEKDEEENNDQDDAAEVVSDIELSSESDENSLENLGLKDLLDESREVNKDRKGSFLDTVRRIPKNVFDLVDERHGEEFGFKDHKEDEQVGGRESKSKKKKPKNSKENKALKEQAIKEAALEAAIEEHTSLEKIAKGEANEKSKKPVMGEGKGDKSKAVAKAEKAESGKFKSSKSDESSVKKVEEDDEYKDLLKGKLVFGFDKKKKKTSRKLAKAKSQNSDSEGTEDSDDEVEYYSPEDYLFTKSSVDDDNDDVEIEDSTSKSSKTKNKNSGGSLRENVEKFTNGTKSPLTKVLDLLEEGDKKSSLHNDPYSIPKVPVEHLAELENGKNNGNSTKASNKTTGKLPLSSKTVPLSGDKDSKNPLDKFKKNPSLLFDKGNSHDVESSFDFTKSEATSNKVISWSIMGAAVLIAMSMVLI
ncbi:Microtubule-associated protein futsch [Wickerhamomyces ciferrii]|uniref:Microtubule-associated protein futsch n=1 Tax=Wickerhamomyces ciferrii (strain ATCC 14091 / BCRC 22168 / CBS 111 / JCM 3599 / NBRC 0793 / NRRL Y-1031 F-60-10) TaxID=1206466 RepID=K0KWY4_WICCF|nr:Microtubule-associated protein futsch [Wickerhamomyces ciferrii]CCH45999.1 Microtubule-associated protein futsch [Wickerhamomyces ciferrii]